MPSAAKWLVSGTALAVGATFVMALLAPDPAPEITDLPDVVSVPPGPYEYRRAGEYRIGTQVVDAPLEHRTADTPLTIMKYPVGQTAYGVCVDDGGCLPTTSVPGENLPQTDISYDDAIAYAAWYSDKTGLTWRLPSDDEWVRAAGDRVIDDGLGDLNDAKDPAQRWLREYEQQATLRGVADSVLRPNGSLGDNNLGVADLSGNVWEWTDTCFQNGQLNSDGQTIADASDYCGVRAVQGKHRAFIIDFVRDAKVGGCAVGIPPDFLGFRLVLETQS